MNQIQIRRHHLSIDMSPYEEACSIVIPGYQPVFEFEFTIGQLRASEGRKQFLVDVTEAIEDWMLGLPGDISDIERNWRKEMENAFNRSGVLDELSAFRRHA